MLKALNNVRNLAPGGTRGTRQGGVKTGDADGLSKGKPKNKTKKGKENNENTP